MRQFICTVCGYIYDEAAGIPEKGIAPGTKWEDLPQDWTCPLCGADKSEFRERTGDARSAAGNILVKTLVFQGDVLRELSWPQLSAVCSNLAKGCEKQYLPEEAALFQSLSAYYARKTAPVGNTFEELLKLIQTDLETGYPQTAALAAEKSDRGALRALTWGDKVTRILMSLLSRYEKQGNGFLESTNVYVCEICGFIYVGDEPPEVCPVCKVPKQKIRLIQRGAA